MLLADKIGSLERFPLRKPVFFLAPFNAPHQERHIPGKGTHGLQTLRVLRRLSGSQAVDAVPILAGGYRHPGDGKEFIQLVEGCGQSSSSGRYDSGADFHGFVKRCAVKQPGQESDQRCVGGGVVDRTSDHQSVARLEFWGDLIDSVIEDALAKLRAFAAADSATDDLAADLDGFRFDALCCKNFLHFVQCNRSIAVGPGTSVDHQDFHAQAPFQKFKGRGIALFSLTTVSSSQVHFFF